MTNNNIVLLYENLISFKDGFFEKLPFQLAYTIEKNLNLLLPYYASIFQEVNKINAQYGEKENNGEIRVPKEKIQEVNQILKEFGEKEQYQIKLFQLNGEELKDFNITFDQIEKIMPLFKE